MYKLIMGFVAYLVNTNKKRRTLGAAYGAQSGPDVGGSAPKSIFCTEAGKIPVQ